MRDTIGELLVKTRIATSFWFVLCLCLLTLVTQKLQVIYEPCSYWVTALLSEMSIFCVIAGSIIRLVSYGSKHSLQFLSNKPFVPPYTHNLRTTGNVWTFNISNDCSTIGEILLELREIQSVILWYKIICVYCKYVCSSLFGVQRPMAPKLTCLMTAHYTQNDSFTANNSSCFKNIVGYVHYMLQCFFNQLFMPYNIKITKRCTLPYFFMSLLPSSKNKGL